MFRCFSEPILILIISSWGVWDWFAFIMNNFALVLQETGQSNCSKTRSSDIHYGCHVSVTSTLQCWLATICVTTRQLNSVVGKRDLGEISWISAKLIVGQPLSFTSVQNSRKFPECAWLHVGMQTAEFLSLSCAHSSIASQSNFMKTSSCGISMWTSSTFRKQKTLQRYEKGFDDTWGSCRLMWVNSESF